MSESIMSFVFTPTKNDYVKTIQSFHLKQKLMWGLFIMLGLILMCSLPTMLSRNSEFNAYSIFSVLISLVAFLLFFVLQPLYIGRQVDANERITCLTKWDLTDNEIYITTPYTEVKYDWGSFSDFVETKEYFLVLHSVNKRMFQIVPKRAFVSSENIDEFREILITRIRNANAHLKTSPWYIKFRFPIIIFVILGILGILMVGLFIINFITAMQR